MRKILLRPAGMLSNDLYLWMQPKIRCSYLIGKFDTLITTVHAF